MCVALGETNGDISSTKSGSLVASLLTRLSALSGANLRQLAGPRLLLATAGVATALYTHRYLLNSWGNNHLGEGMVGILLIVTAGVGTFLLPLIWLLDVLTAVSHGGSDSLQQFEFLQPRFL